MKKYDAEITFNEQKVKTTCQQPFKESKAKNYFPFSLGDVNVIDGSNTNPSNGASIAPVINERMSLSETCLLPLAT